MEKTRIPRTHRRLIVERSVAAVLVAAFAFAAFVLVWRERNEAALAVAAERLMAGDAVAAARILPKRGDGRARAGRALAGARAPLASAITSTMSASARYPVP